MLSNDIKKGDRIVLRNGWEAEMMDNAKGVVRMARVHGFETEIGSIYMYDVAVVETASGSWEPVKFTDGQRKQIEKIKKALRNI